jgi:IclR family pca regulon transcriptional regulator
MRFMENVNTETNNVRGRQDPRFMTSLARGLQVRAAFEGHAALTVSQAAKAAGLPRSSVARCLFTLEQLGYVALNEGAYQLRPALLPLLRAYSYSDPLVRAGQPVVDAIRDRLGESCSIGIFDARQQHDSVIYICRAETARIISVPLLVGSTLPSHCTSMGRVLLAALPADLLERFLATASLAQRTPKTITQPEQLRAELRKIREAGWAVTDGELEPGLRSIAVPVRNGAGNVVAALNLGTQVARRDPEWLLKTALPELQTAAAHLARVAGAGV